MDLTPHEVIFAVAFELFWARAMILIGIVSAIITWSILDYRTASERSIVRSIKEGIKHHV